MTLALNRSQMLAVLLTLLSVSFIFFNPTALPLEPQQKVSACLIITALILFATSALAEHVTAILFLVCAMLLAIAPAEVVFSGFTSTACWLIFAGLIIGIAINETGLAARIAALTTRHLDSSYPRLIIGLVVIAALLGFLMPSSMGRAVLFIPIAMAIAKQCGFTEGSNGQIGVALAAAFGCHVPTFAILPANMPNMVLIGAAETLHNWSPLYAEYLLLHFPVLGILKCILIIALILWLYPDTPSRHQTCKEQKALSADERKLLIILLVTLGFWLTDSLHHISAAWIGMAAACFLLMPGIGMISQKSFNTKLNMSSLFLVAAILGLGTLINHNGLGIIVGDILNDLLPLQQGADFLNFMALTLTSFTTALFTTLPGVPAVLTPLAEQMSENSGFSVQAVIMTQVLGFSTVLLPYQSGPLIISLQLSGIAMKHAAKLCIAIAIVSVLFLFPLDYLWWQLLGWI